MNDLKSTLSAFSRARFGRDIADLNVYELHTVAANVVTEKIAYDWQKSREKNITNRTALYFSAEFLMGRMIYNNLVVLGLLDEFSSALESLGRSIDEFETIGDMGLGNGGLGRLAACFLDSAATHGIPLDGYGIKYKYGIFKQQIKDGFQREAVDDWTAFSDPWTVRCDNDTVFVNLFGKTVKAVPYDMAVIGFKSDTVGNLRLWQAEPSVPFDFEQFNNQNYQAALENAVEAENISRVLYPNDSAYNGKKLRLSQQYFFCSASLKDRLSKYKKMYGSDFSKLRELITIQLNDTHPVIAIPEFIRLLTVEEGQNFDTAFALARDIFNYTNHTVMPEALEKWDINLIKSLCPDLEKIIIELNSRLAKETNGRLKIIDGNMVNMAYLACFVSKSVNGVAKIHTEILKNRVLSEWDELYPDKINNKTNGITPRRWLLVANPALSAMITKHLGSEDWVKNLDELERLKPLVDNGSVIMEFADIKRENKKKLADFILQKEGVKIDPEWIFDVQIKRLHEYKRQLLNAFSILELYFEIKEKSLTEFYPTVFIFGAKAAPGYKRAKGIIKFICELADFIEKDDEANKFIKIVFISDYNVSYAEKLVAGADVSVQISTAGTEASGTGNMKLALNGAVTLGTFDGANIEIAEKAGIENNYIFGATVDLIKQIENSYNPREYYENDHKIRRCIDFLTSNKISDGGTGVFHELQDSLLRGASWHRADNYYLLYDFEHFLETRIQLNNDYKNEGYFVRKCFCNFTSVGAFSADRTVKEYAEDIWNI